MARLASSQRWKEKQERCSPRAPYEPAPSKQVCGTLQWCRVLGFAQGLDCLMGGIVRERLEIQGTPGVPIWDD